MSKILNRAAAVLIGTVQLVTTAALSAPASAAGVEISPDTIAVGENHSLVIRSDLSLWAAGSNEMGQLGVDDIEESSGIKVMNNVVFVEANDDVSFAINAAGVLYGWGDNTDGQIVPGGEWYYTKPVKLMENVAAVAAGDTHTLALSVDGTLYGWGSNSTGELGFSSNGADNKVTEIAKNVADIAAGDGFSLYVTDSGALYSCGSNSCGQLGYGNYRDQESPVLILKSGVSAVEAGNSHSVVLKTDGTVWTCGLNDDGQLGDKSTDPSNVLVSANLSGITAVFAGGNSSGALSGAGSLYTWGDNSYGQLHNGKNTSLSSPASVTTGIVSIAFGEEHSLMLRTNGTVSSVGAGSFGKLFNEAAASSIKPVRVLSNAVSYSAGEDHAAAVDMNGNLYTWGSNDCGQLGLGDRVSRKTPTKVSLPEKALNVWCGSKTTFVQGVSKVYVFGSNKDSILGIYSREENVLSPQVNPELAYKNSLCIAAGDEFCVAAIDGKIFGWGKNRAGRLLNMPSSVPYPRQITSDITGAEKIVAGDNHVLALCGDTIYGWGANSSNQLGFSGASLVEEPVAIEVQNSKGEVIETAFKDIAAAGNHSMFISNNGKAWVCGSNSDGQLGTDVYRIKTPLYTAAKASSVIAGKRACGIIFDDGILSLSGDNTNGALGDGTVKNREDFLKTTGKDIASCSIGLGFGGYINSDSVLYCWGDNTFGQVGNGVDGGKGTPETVIRDALCKTLTKAESLSLSASSLTLSVGGIGKLTATVTPADASANVSWSSSNEAVARVSSDGTVTLIANGSAVITARTANGLTASCTVSSQTGVTAVTATPSSKFLNIGGSFTIATKVLPEKASNKTLTFTSTSKRVATVDENGKVTAVSAGKATIVVRSKSNPTASCRITVKVRPNKASVTSVKYVTGGVYFKWNAAKGADGYDVFRNIEGKTSPKSIADVGNSLTFTDKTMQKGTVYIYSIRAYKIIDGKKVYASTYTRYRATGR